MSVGHEYGDVVADAHAGHHAPNQARGKHRKHSRRAADLHKMFHRVLSFVSVGELSGSRWRPCSFDARKTIMVCRFLTALSPARYGNVKSLPHPNRCILLG